MWIHITTKKKKSVVQYQQLYVIMRLPWTLFESRKTNINIKKKIDNIILTSASKAFIDYKSLVPVS